MIICMVCETVFREELNIFRGSSCPKIECQGQLIHLDENMYEVYKLLNSKGFVTRNCCTAHSYDERPKLYIQFEDAYIFPTLPCSFKTEVHDVGRGKWATISKEFNYQSTVDLQMQIWQTCADLLQWAEQLKKNE